MEPSMERGSTARVGRAEDNEGRLSSAPLHPLSLLANEDHLPQEVEEGNVEYKLKLNPSPERLQHLVTQMKWRYECHVVRLGRPRVQLKAYVFDL